MSDEITDSMLEKIKTTSSETYQLKSEFVFGREFRWTMASDTLAAFCCKRVKFNYVSKKIFLELYDLYDSSKKILPAFQWLNGPLDDLTFKSYDGCGNVLYSAKFKFLTLLKHTCKFDMASTEAAIERVVIDYKSMEVDFNGR